MRPVGLCGLQNMSAEESLSDAARWSTSISQRLPRRASGERTSSRPALTATRRNGGYTGVGTTTLEPPKARAATLKPGTTPGSQTSQSGCTFQPQCHSTQPKKASMASSGAAV